MKMIRDADAFKFWHSTKDVVLRTLFRPITKPETEIVLVAESYESLIDRDNRDIMRIHFLPFRYRSSLEIHGYEVWNDKILSGEPISVHAVSFGTYQADSSWHFAWGLMGQLHDVGKQQFSDICTCDITTLMTSGCRCGHLKR